MGHEIERKFLVKTDAWRRHGAEAVRMRQGYLNKNGPSSIRVRVAGDHAALNIKSATLGVSRAEFEYPIPLNDAEHILCSLCLKPLIEKTRYKIEYAGHLWEIDVFEGDNAGLVVAEIELDAADEPFPLPDWAGAEVSDDPRFYNVCLVSHPYKNW
ncbi:MAG: CYTH domain-containing protein [Gammaproteobacteria bacterium]